MRNLASPSMRFFSRRCFAGSATRAAAPWCSTAATARCWRWAPTRCTIRRCSIPACRRRSGRSGRATSARRCSTERSRAVCAWLDLQDGGGDGGTGGAHHHAGRCRPLFRLHGPRQRAVPLLAQGRPRLTGSARRDQERRDVYFYETAKRVGIDRIAAMSRRFGLGTELEIDLPGARPHFMPTREWRIGQGHPWNLGDTVVSGIGQGYIQVTPPSSGSSSICVSSSSMASRRTQ